MLISHSCKIIKSSSLHLSYTHPHNTSHNITESIARPFIPYRVIYNMIIFLHCTVTSRFWCPFLEHIHLPLCHWYSFILKLISITLDHGKNCLKFFFVSCSPEQRSRLNVRIYLCCHLMVSFFKICAHGLFTYQNDLTIPASTIKHFFSFLFSFFFEFFSSK